MRRWLMLILVVALIIPAGQALAADSTKKIEVSFAPIHYVMNGTVYVSPEGQSGFIYQGSTYVPLRFVGNLLSKSTVWDGKAAKITVGEPKEGDLPAINKYLSALKAKQDDIRLVDSTKIPLTSIEISTREITYELDGKIVAPDPKTPGFIYNGSTYVPLRFIYESLGFKPEFNKGYYTITSSSKAYGAMIKPVTDKISACTQETMKKYTEYNTQKATITEERKKELYDEVDKLLTDCKSELVTMLDELSDQLTAAGLATEIVDDYHVQIESQEKFARNFMENSLK